MPNIELISFKLCPFVQRSVITLLEKDIPFDITYIDLDDKPDWFLAISPTGKVPVLKINQDKILFESAVINEYLDEITSPSLHPDDPFTKAQHRAWIEFGSGLLMTSYRFMVATEQAKLDEHREQLINLLIKLEQEVSGKTFFNGKSFSLVDAALAPIFRWLEIMDRRLNTQLMLKAPGLIPWSNNMLRRPSVKNAVVDDFETLYIDRLRDSDALLRLNIQ
ncbi:glutathione S-transferase family protein [Endozoicomonas arenosclerae]|uniref:glutathione S-transferase family protein n=1 Tax=Endozoicomonas arenosclerae TaxID=1633495 RepID=UPI0007865943|nr:glutathione S-transferase family protein [Endozoicomonas arenosclerae]